MLSEALYEHAKQLLHDAKRADYLPEQIDYMKAVWTHQYPDHRAQALVSAHYVLLIQFCMAHRVVPPRDGRFAYFVQATVHASQRSHHRAPLSAHRIRRYAAAETLPLALGGMLM